MYGAVMEKERKTVNSAVLSENRSAVRENRTGIPTQLKESMERNTGLSFDDVRVHYNSALPARLDALAYTQGNQVEIGPGQERHLPHELGHVVQQKLGAVRANATHSSGVALNTDPALEHQADELGAGKKLAIVQRMRNNNIIQRCGDPEDSPKEEEKEDESQKQESQEQSPSSDSQETGVEVGEGGSQTIDPNTIRFCQSSVNGSEDIVKSMTENGWVGAPIDVVKMSDGGYTTIDNTRVVAARKAGINVQANVHVLSDPLPPEYVERFTTKKGTPKTWGEAIILRIGKQKSDFRKNNPFGSLVMDEENIK